MEFVLRFCSFSLTIFRYFSLHGRFFHSCFQKWSKYHDPGGRNGVCAGHPALRAAGAVHCGGDGGGWGSAGLGKHSRSEGAAWKWRWVWTGPTPAEETFQLSLESSCWEVHRRHWEESVCLLLLSQRAWGWSGPSMGWSPEIVSVCPGCSRDKAEPSRGGF